MTADATLPASDDLTAGSLATRQEHPMADYTPATPQVRAAYVRAMRNAFITSTAEHEAEFDRWLALHETRIKAEAFDKAVKATLKEMAMVPADFEELVKNPYIEEEFGHH